ncbi:MAG: AAA family ATPase [Desulfobacterales bacterium]|nr:AAA family ATPase [Desulfobacterales bacterium]MBF0397478.1 AAA family ATPase [Desulfobacterales bacterium]
MSDNIPTPKELEKEIGEFLAQKFGNNVKIVSAGIFPEEALTEPNEQERKVTKKKKKINFNLKPAELISYLDRYIIKQDNAKAILATKICTHFNRIRLLESSNGNNNEMVGGIKNNVLMVGPTGAGKTYMVKLIAKKIGVPFVKGDATKFSETGYVGGDVEDLVRDLVREANDNLELAQYGIIYIDEIDKIASSGHLIGADISRTGVQRALLKPMEDTDIDLKVPHDPISVMQDLEHYRKTGKRNKRVINTKNILFIMSGAFADIAPIIKKRVAKQEIGFGANITSLKENDQFLQFLKAEDLVSFGFESEFVGRLPVKAVFDKLKEEDLYEILKNPNNPIILGKKLDFSAYGIDIKFDDEALRLIAKDAYSENTGARGLISAIEKVLLLFEKRLPSTQVKKLPVTRFIIENQEQALKELEGLIPPSNNLYEIFEELLNKEKEFVKDYIAKNINNLTEKFSINLTPNRINIITEFYLKNIMDIESVIRKIKPNYEEAKKIELYFFNDNNINIVFEDDALDFIVEERLNSSVSIDSIYKKILSDFELGLKLVREKTGKTRFFIDKEALLSPEEYLENLIKSEMKHLVEDLEED